MRNGRWVAVGCATLFALPFCAAGLIIITTSVYSTPGRFVLVAAGSVFLIAGLAIIGASIAVARTAGMVMTLSERDPEKPWLWRKDWAENSIRDQGVFFVGFLWVFTVIWNLISIPALMALTPKLVKQAPLITFAYFFPVIGAALVVWAIYLTWRRAKYGVSICHVDRVPIVPGRTFHGEITTRVRATPINGFVFKLTAARRTSRGRNTHEDVLWREEQTVALATPSYEGVRVPFSFDIPADTPGMNDVNEDGAVLWRLEVSAEVPGVDYAAAFDMPVFRTGEKAEQSHALWPAPHADERLWVPDPKSNIAIEPLPNGGEGIRIGSPGGGAFGFAVFLFIWWGVVGMMAIFDAPVFLPIIFGFAGVLILLVAIDWWIGRSHIEASRRTLVYKRAWLGFGPQRTIASGEIDDVTTTIGTTVGEGSGSTLYYDLIAHQGERKRRIARYLRSKRDAEMLAARIRRDLGIATPA